MSIIKGVSTQELASAINAEEASAPQHQLVVLGAMVGGIVLWQTVSPAIAIAVVIAAMGNIAQTFGKMIGVANAAADDDMDALLSKLPAKRRAKLMKSYLQGLKAQQEAIDVPVTEDSSDEQPAIAPAKPVDTTAVDVSAPFKLADLKAPVEPAPAVTPQDDNLDRYWGAPVDAPAVAEFDMADELSAIPAEDLAQTIGQCPEDESNFIFVGKSRSGKTSMIINAMKAKEQWTKKTSVFMILNGKPERDNQWGGLVGTTCYYAINNRDRALNGFKIMDRLVRKLGEWQDNPVKHPSLFVVADEVNNQQILLPTKQRPEYSELLSLFATQCMSERSGLWLSSHSHLVSDVGLNRQIQQSFQVVALGREGKYETITAVLDDQYIIRDMDLRMALKTQLRDYVSQGNTGAIAFTNQGGNPRLVALPQYSKNLTIFSLGARKQEAQGEVNQGGPTTDAPVVDDADSALIEKMKALKTEHPDWGKVDVLKAATGRKPGGSPEYVKAQELYEVIK